MSNRGGSGWKYLCLDHVREFNARYNYFDGQDPATIAVETDTPGWQRATRAFASNAYSNVFRDPLGAVRGRFGGDVFDAGPVRQGEVIGPADRAALRNLGLDATAAWKDIRARYKRLLREYHPDSNGGDRSREAKLRSVIDAYTQLRDSPAFGRKTGQD